MQSDAKIQCLYDELIDPNKLKNHPKNRNKHGQDQIERLAELYSYQGIRHPIIVSKLSGFIVAGHGRKLAAIRAGIKKVPVVYQDFDSSEQEYAFIQSDNAIALWAELDLSGINQDMQDLGPDFDINMLGLKDFKLDLIENEELGDPDDVPEPMPDPKVVRGEVYILGSHRLMCGDSTVITDVEKLMNGEKADMVFTDPPYGVDYRGGHNEKKRSGIENDTLIGGDLTDLFKDALALACAVSSDHAAFYIWYANGKAVETFASFAQLPLRVRAVICWYKVRSGLGAFMSQYIPNYEPCIYAFKDGCSPQWFGPSDEKTVWELPKERVNEHHPTQKPVELPARAIRNSSQNNQIVLDFFGGSGSTLIACEKTNRRCFMMELDPHYCGVILDRWQKFTGKKAHREDGVPWDEIKG